MNDMPEPSPARLPAKSHSTSHGIAPGKSARATGTGLGYNPASRRFTTIVLRTAHEHWLITLMNDGKYRGKQVLPTDVLKQTLQPAIALPNTAAEQRGFWEVLNAAYGMGRQTATYRGHLITYHGGDLPGFHSQVSFLPKERIGVVVFVVGNHTAPLYNYVTYNVYERLLGMDQTPWIQRGLDIRLKAKEANARAKEGG
jgi:hypothetical protein